MNESLLFYTVKEVLWNATNPLELTVLLGFRRSFDNMVNTFRRIWGSLVVWRQVFKTGNNWSRCSPMTGPEKDITIKITRFYKAYIDTGVTISFVALNNINREICCRGCKLATRTITVQHIFLVSTYFKLILQFILRIFGVTITFLGLSSHTLVFIRNL